MGEHSKPDGMGYVRTALVWVAGHKKTILAFAAGVIAAVSAVKPDFPASAVMGALHALLGV
ncbi:hypothetical protein [Streptomyces reniochalinae]|uniref:Uncharacterized protein n=1 Tax=Streptomyces reniochalinae TaxID=2250578 RepID=A0A367EFV1_9ACTN|nr:hypothetical protein [Streptomyces reniochalinae]RCG16976.1 hypothetical protein DQ392_18020 [Streptomyces reniochalinae]